MATSPDPVVIHDNTDGTPLSPANEPLNPPSQVKPSVGDGSRALDDLLVEKGGTTADPDAPLKTPDERAAEREAADDKKEADDEKFVADKKAADEKTAADQRAADEKIIADKKAADDKAAGKTLEVKVVAPIVEPDDRFSKIKLPPNSRGAVTDSFNAVKSAAREETQRLTAEVEALKKKIPADGSAIPPELQKELDGLRAFQAVHNYQNNPEFLNTYVAPVEANNNAILAKLKEAGFTEDHLGKIKAIGLAKLDWEPVLAALPSVARRVVEAKLLDNETLNEKKAAAIAAAEKAPGEFTAKRVKEADALRTQENSRFVGTVNAVLEKVDWYKARDIPAGATAAEKAVIDKHNVFVKDQSDRRAVMEADNSPEMRGTLVASTLLAYHFKQVAADATARAEAAEAELERVRKSSSTARRNSQAPAVGTIPPKPGSITATGKSAFDAFEESQPKR